MHYDLTINPIKKVRKKKEINWRYKKTNTPKEDLQKFIKMKSKKGKFEDANRLQIKAYTKIHKEYPLVRFYNFRKTARDVAFKFYDNDEFMYNEYYNGYNVGFTPDGYFFGWDKNGMLDIFLIEVENYSRITNNKIARISDWWHYFDDHKSTGLYILEFNRYGDFQRVVNYKPFGLYEFAGYDDNPLELLKKYMNQ